MSPAVDVAGDTAAGFDLGSALLGGDDEEVEAVEADGVGAWLDALVDTALERGSTRAAAVIGELIQSRSVEAGALGKSAAAALEQARIAELKRGRLRPLPEFLDAMNGWQTILSGEGSTAVAGADTLDDFSATLLAALSGDLHLRGELKHELRRRGVAAFGMLDAA